MYRKWSKRLVDLALSAAGLVLLWPAIMLFGFAWWCRYREHPFFMQERVGRNNRMFVILKLKTMKSLYGTDGKLLPDAARVTSMGRFLRDFSLDELPQLWNVLKGEMSLVGPRPLLTEYLPLYDRGQLRRHEVLPGITGWAQVNGRDRITWQEQFEYDVWYVDHLSFWVDLKILRMTFQKKGTKSRAAVAIRERFRGTTGI